MQQLHQDGRCEPTRWIAVLAGSSLLPRNDPRPRVASSRFCLRCKMDEPRKPDESLDESLAVVPPTPVVAPQAPSASNLGLNAALLTAAGAGAFFLIAGTMTPCVGATRSTKLKWEERQLQIEQAER